MAEEKPKSIFYSLSQALKGEKKDIPAELNRTNNLVNPSATNQDADFIQQNQQRFLDFQSLKISQDLYTRSVYYDSDRITAYNDYRAMDQSPEISVALDIMADESLSRGDDGEILKIYSEDSRIKRVLKDLFHKTLNVNYNLWFWTRTLLKYGDNFLKLEIDQKLGIYNITQLPTGEIHKEMGWDGNPYSTRFKWDIQNMYFEDFQIAHFSLISDGEKMPYGRSCLDSVRKIWKQLQLAEDAMLVYRMCLQGETRIRTTNGYKYIKDIAVGDEVISYNQSGNLEKSKVIHHINNGKKKLLRIRSIHNELICTETHPILINDNGVIKYVDAAELKIKKHKLINTNTSNLNIKEKEIELFFTEKYGKLSKKAIDLLRDRKYLNKSSIINSCLKTDKFDNGRIKQFIYSEKKGLPIDIAMDVCEKFDIDVKNLIVYNKSFFNEDRLNLPKFVTPEFSRLLGFLFGDGWISKNKFGFAEGVDENVNSQYKKLLEKYFSKVVYEPDKREGKKHGKYTVNSTLAVNILKSLGFNGKANTKRIPSWLFSCSAEIRKEFILGLSDADGGERFTNKGTWFSTIELCNKKLIEDVKELWSSIGLCSGHIKTRKRIGGHVIDKVSGRVIKDTISHSVTISELELPKYENVISIEEFGEEDVYDISVDNKLHNFIANNVPVHNTRAPERRMFFLDVGNTDAPDVQQYVEKIMSRIKKSQVVDPKTGNINMKFNMMTFEEDFVIPVRGDKTGTRVETLPGACLSLDTEIYLLDGRCLSLNDIIKEFESGKKLESYSINPKTGEIVPGKITWAGITRKNTEVIKITLDNGESIVCTPDHKFPTRFNGKKEAKDLSIDDSLFGFVKNENGEIWDDEISNYVSVIDIKNREIGGDVIVEREQYLGFERKSSVKIQSIEWLDKKQDTGTITIDGDEEFHNFHNFALKCGVFTQNSNLGDIMDIEYLQNKLFTGIKVPKAYLNYAEGLPGSSTLSQADLRFSRTINRFQEAIILELRNIANIHLKLLGFDDDLNNFTLTLTNPSTQQELLKLETMKARNDVFKEMFSSDATSPVSYTWAMEYILGFSKSEIKQMVRQKKIERKMFYEIERAHEEYQDTGIFTELDKKFRKPDFDPNTQIDTENGPGGEDSGGGGGGGSFGGGSSFGMDDLGGGMDMGTETAPETGPEGTEMAGAEDTGTEEEQPPLQENVLLKKNQVFDLKTKNILNGIDSFLKKINQLNENK